MTSECTSALGPPLHFAAEIRPRRKDGRLHRSTTWAEGFHRQPQWLGAQFSLRTSSPESLESRCDSVWSRFTSTLSCSCDRVSTMIDKGRLRGHIRTRSAVSTAEHPRPGVRCTDHIDDVQEASRLGEAALPDRTACSDVFRRSRRTAQTDGDGGQCSST